MTYTNMNELMQHYRSMAAQNNWAEAHEILLYGTECSYLPAKLELSRFYKNCLLPGTPYREQYAKAESHYREILNLLDLTDHNVATVALELTELYFRMDRPVGVLAMLLRAKRYGIDVPEEKVERAKKLLMGLDVNDFGKSALDAYDLATELLLAGGSVRFIELLLREASESSNKLIRAKASLMLADFYNDQRSDAVYAHEAARYYRLAAEAGYPEYLSR